MSGAESGNNAWKELEINGCQSEHSPRLVDITKKLKGFELEIAFEAGWAVWGSWALPAVEEHDLKVIAGIETPGAGRIALQYASGEAPAGGCSTIHSSR